MARVRAAEYWDREAESFDAQPDHGLSDPRVRAAWSGLLLALLSPAPARVADLGCGTGSLSVLLAEAGHLVSGLDISPRMVAAARAKVAASGLHAEFTVGDAGAPPWPPGSFDVVLTRHVLWAMDDPDAAVTAWLELLAPHGRLIVIEGRWWTGAGLSAAEVCKLVLAHRGEAVVPPLDDPALWGGPTGDERFAVLSRR